jgi:hypothetical protein
MGFILARPGWIPEEEGIYSGRAKKLGVGKPPFGIDYPPVGLLNL